MNGQRKPAWLAANGKINAVRQRRGLHLPRVSAQVAFAWVALATGGFLAAEAQAEQPPGGVTIRAELKGLRSDSGQAGCSLFASPDGFPSKSDKAVQRRWVPIKGKAAVCEFDGLPPGNYALAAIHDENGDGKLDKNGVGAPTEGVGTSRDARPGFMRGPRFEDAVLQFKAGTSTVPIPIHYRRVAP